MKKEVFLPEHLAYALVYWYTYWLTKALDPDKAEEAAEQVLYYLATNFSRKQALEYVYTYRLYESRLWVSL